MVQFKNIKHKKLQAEIDELLTTKFEYLAHVSLLIKQLVATHQSYISNSLCATEHVSCTIVR